MDSKQLLKFIEYFPNYLLALSHTLLRFFGQPLSKQLYTQTDIPVSSGNIIYSKEKEAKYHTSKLLH